MTIRVQTITENCFHKYGDVQVFNDVALNAVNIIYKVNFFVNFLIKKNKYLILFFFQLTIKPDETCRLMINRFYNHMNEKKNGKINNFIVFSQQ